MRTAIAKRGVAVIVIPGDVALRDVSAAALPLGIDGAVSTLRPPTEQLKRAAQLLNGSQK
jgi:pyruvate dehydrogenase (quinone)